MCGICGIAGKNLGGQQALASIVRAMNDCILHRGPDDTGEWISAEVAVAMRRLAIIDLKSGHQPIENEAGDRRIVFNGEIYNYRELRQQLVTQGHRFKTQSDTEVVLRLYEVYGPEFVEMLKGMFALCIVDDRDRSIFLARDRFGEKPLYFWDHDGVLAFSSELHSLLQFSRIPRRLNPNALPFYLRNGFVPSPQTMYAGIQQLPAGHWMRWSAGKRTQQAYFRIEFPVEKNLDETTAADLVRAAVLAAVDRQRVSDVPIGAFLSGGIDSSTVVAALQRLSDKPVPTFTAKFEHDRYDESPIARAVAKHVGSDHHEFTIPNRGFQDDDMLRVLRHVGQPFGDSSAIPTYYISRQIRQSVKVCLSGDGGDEMFGGYDFFQDVGKVDRIADRLPRWAYRWAEAATRLAGRLPYFRGKSQLRQARQAFDTAAAPRQERFQRFAPRFDSRELKALLQNQSSGLSFDPHAINPMLSGGDCPTRLRRLMAYRIGYSLSEDMLVKVDRMSMAASLEVRAPFLDIDIFSIAARLPDSMLIRGGVGKHILRTAVKDWLPPEVFSHPKQGFAIPLHTYQNDRYRQMCMDLLAPGRNAAIDQLFAPGPLASIVNRGLTRQQDAADVSVFRASHQLWQLVQLAAWFDQYRVELA